MGPELICYRCGGSLAALSLPLSRRDLCPQCAVDLHCCRMCTHFDPAVAKRCREDDAEEVSNKERANFCDWFDAACVTFDARRKSQDDQARLAARALFGDGHGDRTDSNAALSEAERLFRGDND